MLGEPIARPSILNEHPAFIEGPSLLHHLVQRSSSAGEPAIDFLENGLRKTLSYESLHALSDDLAADIIHSLVGLEYASTIVPVFLPQGTDLYIALLAILKAGKAFCPISLDTPDERLKFILKDLSANIIITTRTHQAVLGHLDNVKILLADQLSPSPKIDRRPATPCIQTNNLAYVLYTSGSTGLPKAVSVSHRAATQSLLAHHRHVPSFERFLQFAAPTFDVSIFEIFFPLFRGRTVVGCSREQMLSNLPAIMNELEVDAAELTPTVVSNLLQGRKSVPKLRLLLTIGEMLTRAIIDEFGGNSNKTSILWGMYGPTEAAIHCTLQPNFQTHSSAGHIGFPLDTVSAFVMVPATEANIPNSTEVLPIGEVGELVLGGPQIADEYLNRKELTAASFIQHPKFGLLYRTGDKARMLPSGTLECLGRIATGQVKLRGQRVELGEIEQAILRIDGCHSASVLVIDDNPVAFCTTDSQHVSRNIVVQNCKRWLPSHMIPTDVVLTSCMPQLSSGKIDKKALESRYRHEHRTTELRPAYPMSPIHQIIQRVLNRDISLETSLSSAGIDSLRAIQIASKLQQEGYDLGATDVLSATSIDSLISFFGNARVTPEQSPQTSISFPKETLPSRLEQYSEDITDVIPCTPLQESMLAETFARPDAYCNWIEIELSTYHTFSEIQRCLEDLAAANEIMRSGFFATSTSTQSSFAQIIWKTMDETQIYEVTWFSRKFSLGSVESLLRPISIQVNTKLDKPRILFQLHHSLYDGWSFDIILCDLSNLLRRQTNDNRPQYREVVNFYLQERHGERHAASISYWMNILEGYSPRPLPNFNGKTLHDGPLHSISGESSVSAPSLYERASEYAVNPQVFFQAAVMYMMASFHGTSDVVIGTVTSGRTIPVTGIERIVGPCIASLPLRVDISDAANVRAILDDIQTSNRDMLQHCTLALRDIQKLCGLHSKIPLFDTLFVWQESLFSDALAQSGIRILDSADELEFKLILEFEPRPGSIHYKTTFDPRTIPEAQVLHLSAQIDELVQFFLRSANSNFDSIRRCFSTRSLSIANPTPLQEDIRHGPAHAVERWASEAPDRTALLFGTVVSGIMEPSLELTYNVLNTRANQLAHALLMRGASKDELICVLIEKSINLYVAILAVQKLGCGYLPIVPETPLERTSQIIADAHVKICISESKTPNRHPIAHFCEILDLDKTDLSRYSHQNLDVTYDGSRLAYAIFTSGSTGIPKGVLVTQDNLMSNLKFLYKLYPTSYDGRLLQACSQAFDVSAFEIFFTWYAGMCLCVAAKDDLYKNFEDSIARLEITHLSLTPTVASLVRPSRVPSVRFLVTAGEALTEHVRRQWAGKGLYQGYGPSETTNICTVRASVTSDDLINNIGPPFSNTSAFVLDPASDDLVPRGGVGELCFGGAQVFRGYLNRPELNARKIINHPQYGRIYRSGDMGMLLPDDAILFVGRSDDQVKIRGQRVELGEITSIVLDSPDVEDCVTLLFHLDGAVERLVTFWVPVDVNAFSNLFETLAPEEFTLATCAIFESLALKLPIYMVPTHLVPITRIPLTSQSKVDKRSLFSFYKDLSNKFLDSITSSGPTNGEALGLSNREYEFAKVLSETIHVPLSEISRNSSFFGLGLDSISAIQFSTRLRDSGIADAAVSTIMKNPTVARLSAIATQIPRFEASISDPIDSLRMLPSASISHITAEFSDRGIPVQDVLPCTPLQEAMLSDMSLSANSSYYNVMVFDVAGDIAVLKKCWSRMFERHNILRTAFVPTDDANFAYAQAILEFREPEWDKLSPDEHIENYATKVLSTLLKSSQPPVRLALRQIPKSCQLIFCCHHALYDGIAITTLLEEIERVYSGHTLPSLIPYERYLRHVVSQDFHAADIFWNSALAGVSPTFFPNISGVNLPNGASASSSTQTMQLPLSKTLKFCQKASVSLLSVIQAAWAKILHFYLGEDDICFGNVVSGRALPEKDLERLVAPCFNTLPVRLNFDFSNSNIDMVRQLHRFNIDSSGFQLTPLRRIQNHLLKEGGHLFDSIVILQQPSIPLNGSIWELQEDKGSMDVPVVCEVLQDKHTDHLSMTIHFHTSLMSEDDAKLVVETFNQALVSLVQFPDSSASDTIGFPPELLAASNLSFTKLRPAPGPFLHSAFEQNAEQYPELTALDFRHADGSHTIWTFACLNGIANQIAHALIESDVKPEDVIPIHIAKSPQFYASILGILKSGAAFSPIHPDLPQARKKFMLSELQPKVLLYVDGLDMEWCGDISVLNVESSTRQPKDNPTVDHRAPNNLAYCLYTSGSTGTPKAVSMEHHSPIQTIESSRQAIPWTQTSRLLQYAAISFDMCYYDCFLAWSFGFTLCAAEQEGMLNDISGIIQSLKADLLDLTPSVAASIKRCDVPSVKWLYCIGEAMSPDVVRDWEGVCVNSYGPTEAAFCTTIFPVRTNVKTNIIGKPFSTTSFAVYPERGDRTLPIFGLGELYIGGAQLARCYLSRRQLTEEKFVQRDGQRYYKTGDIVRMLGDGNFEFVGRADDQVKIRGLRVELGEISHVIRNCDESVLSVTTHILKKTPDSKDQLVSFIVTRNRLDAAAQSCLRTTAKQAAADGLPAYMVPQFFIFVDRIPKSAAGKVDKNALLSTFRQSEDEALDSEDSVKMAGEHQWTDTETQIREVFAKLSKTSAEEIRPTTTIYQLGLDSISAVQVAAGLRKKGKVANAVDVLKYMNCIDLAAFINRNSSGPIAEPDVFDFKSFDKQFRSNVLESIDCDSKDVEMISPCTPVQGGMVSQFLSREGSIYYNYLRLQLHPEVDLSRLKHSWSLITKRHGMLRTGFVHIKDKKWSFAMVRYISTASKIPWDDTSSVSKSISVDVWLSQSARNASKQLHRPPWRIRAVNSNGEQHLDLALFHGLFDAQSLQIILNDVATAYEDVLLSSPKRIEPVISKIIGIGSNVQAQKNAFWSGLGKMVTPTRFPNLTPLRYDPSPPIIVTRDCTKSLPELEVGCRKSNITLQAAGIASWATILSEYSGEPSVTCGVVLSGRNYEAAESAAFPCITTVPFVCAVSENREKTLQDIMMLNTEIQQYQFTPLNEIQRLMGYPNESLFDSIFAFQKIQGDQSQRDLWTIVDERATIEYPISIELEPKGQRLEFRLTFLPHVIPEEQADVLLAQLDHLFTGYVFLKSQPVVEENFDPVLYAINPAKESTLVSDVALLHELVEYSATKHPKRIALEFATSILYDSYISKSWTYDELNSEGNRIANLIISHDVKPGALVAVCFDKCPQASFAMLGILKAGCAFVALDPGAPNARRAFIVRDSGAKLILSMKAQSCDLPGDLDVPILNLDGLDLKSLSSEKPKLQREINPQDRSYCLYTSGTTGTPKGCELTHENAVQALLSFQRIFAGHWDENSRWLQFASFHFDVSVLEQYWSWSVGICVISTPRDLIFQDLAAAIRVLKITHIDLTPSLARILHPDDVPSLCKGVFITGGESLKQEILDVWGPKGVIYNGYGPTEATIGVTMYPRVPANGKPSNIGPQFDNVGSFVLKPSLEIPVLRGGVGELCVSGKLVGKGYLNRPELTKERFPTLKHFNERVYRTGDLVRILHDGTFDFLGRVDDQVKLRGQRLEVGEINAAIKQSTPKISDVTTLVLKHPQQQKEQLVSFVVAEAKEKSEPRILVEKTTELDKAREACLEKLPGYMVPTHFVTLSAMPLSANNKVDSRKLGEMYKAFSVSDLQQLSSLANENEGSWSKHERKIREVLKDSLQISVDEIRKSSSFFELGFDSISIIGFSRDLKQAGFSRASVSAIMKNPSINRLSKVLAEKTISDDRGSILVAQQAISAIQHRHRRGVADSLSLDSRDIEVLAPCTPLQQGMIARSLESGQGLYFNSFYLNLHGAVDEEKLQAVWKRAFDSIEVLRTVFVNTEDGFVQAIRRRPLFPWNSHGLSAEDSLDDYLVDMKEKWWNANRELFKRPFELHLVATPKRKVLAVHIFHGLYDGISIELLFKKVWNTYNSGSSINFGPPFHVVLAHGPLRLVNGAREFWTKHISDLTLQRFPSLVGNSQPDVVMVTRTLRDLSDFESVRRRLNVTHQAVAQACWATVLHKHTEGAVTLGIIASGRSIDFEGVDSIVGPLFNTIPYQHRPQHSESWATTIKRTHDFNVAAHPYQHTPLRSIMKWMKRSPDHPLFDTLFVYQIASEDQDWAGNHVWKLEDGATEADYPLALEVEQKCDKSLKLTLVAQGHVLDTETSNRLLDGFEKSLRAALRDAASVVEQSYIDEEVAVEKSAAGEKNMGSTSFDGVKDFQWNETAKKIRKEIADLADAEEESFNESTSIFELGLDSIDAIKLSSKLKKLGLDIPVSSIMRSLTIANMVTQVPSSKPRWSQQPSNMVFQSHKRRLDNYLLRSGVLTDDIEQVLPLTALQEAMVAEMISSEYTRYFNHDVLKLAPDIDLSKLQRAWVTVVKNSPILRTAFIEVDDPSIDFSFTQVVHRTLHDFVSYKQVDEEIDFSSLFDNIRKDAIKATGSTPPFYIHVIDSPYQKYLVLSIAHALYDGWSLELLHSDVHRAYRNQFKPRPSYESSLRDIITASGSDAAAFWRDFLSDARPSTFPRHVTTDSHFLQAVHREESSSEAKPANLSSFAKRNNITIQALGQTVYALVLAFLTHSLDVTFGSVLSGRDDEMASKILFPTMNTVAIRTIIHGSIQEMLQYVQENLASIKQWQHFPLRKAQGLAGIQGQLFESLFIYQRKIDDSNSTENVLYESVQGYSDVEYPVCVEMEIVDEELIWRCAIKEEVFDQAGTLKVLETLDAVLMTILEKPGASAIEFTSEGTSICGLPSFMDDQYADTDNKPLEQGENVVESSMPPIARAIREVLAFVSKTPEEEITEAMTIFHIGLDSISAIKVSSLLRKRSIVLSVGDMLKAGTVEKMAKMAEDRIPITTEEDEDHDATLTESMKHLDLEAAIRQTGIDQTNVEKILPATAGQIYMVSMWLNSEGANFYPKFSYELDGDISFADLRRAWQTLVNATSILKTWFLATNDNQYPYVQVVLCEAEPSISDATGWSEEKMLGVIEERASQQPYAHLFTSKSSIGWTLTLRIHHALYDGVSLPLLMQQLQDLCNSNRTPTTSLVAFSKFIATSSASPSLKSRKSFWTNYLRGVEHRLLQPDSPPTAKTEIFKPKLLPDIKPLETLARKRGISAQSLFLSVYARLYATLTSAPTNQDVVIGIYLANRSHSVHNISQAPIPTLNLVPLRISTPLETDILDIAAQIQYDIQQISSPANSSVSLFEIREWMGIQVDSFVNFLKLPHAGEGSTLKEQEVVVTPVNQWEGEIGRVTEIYCGTFEKPADLIKEHVNGAYLHAIDIEATIRNDSLDVGVFAPDNLLKLETSEKLVGDIKNGLEAVVERVE